MPTDLTPMDVLIWFVVGFATGLGWAVATWLVARVFR